MLDFVAGEATHSQLDVAISSARDPAATYPAAALPWSPPPVPGDRRGFALVPAWETTVAAQPRGLPLEIATRMRAGFPLGLNDLCRVAGRPFRETLPALRDLVARGVLTDADATLESSDDWRSFCLSVLTAVPRAKGRRPSHVKPLLSTNAKLSEVGAALEALDARGLLVDPADVVISFTQRDAGACAAAATSCAAPEEVPSKPEPVSPEAMSGERPPAAVPAAREIGVAFGIEPPTINGRHLSEQVGRFISEHRQSPLASAA